MKKISLYAIFIGIFAITATAQEITYTDYMTRSIENNAALAAQKLNIDISEAEVKKSHISNDPSISIGYENNEDWNFDLGESISAELSRTFTFGVRKAGIYLAEKEKEAATAAVHEYLRNFQAEATIAYLSHIKEITLKKALVKNYENLKNISKIDSIRFEKGEIAEAEWIRSRLECTLAQNDVTAAEAKISETAVTLGYYMGNPEKSETLRGQGTLDITTTPSDIDSYISTALERRTDLIVAMANTETAKAVQLLNRRSRRTDLTLNIGAEYNTGAEGTPDFTKFIVGAAMPIKISNLNKGAREADRLRVIQAEQEETNARLTVQTEVMQAYGNYKSAETQVNTFGKKILVEAEELLDSKTKAYETGEISLTDWIDIQQTVNRIHIGYTETLYRKALCWVELQRSIGCDIRF